MTKTQLIYLVAAFALIPQLLSGQTTWRDAYNRGSPTIVSYCADPTYTKLADGICYPPCPATFTAVLNDLNCYGPCYSGYTDSGTTCANTGDYWRPVGVSTLSGCQSSGSYDPLYGCELMLSMWYHNCRQGYYSTAGSVCQCFPSFNPQVKTVHTRTGVLPICDPLERDPVDGLCYPRCLPGYTPEKNICWKTACPSGTNVCGTALCLASASTCSGSAESAQATSVYNQVFAVSSGGTTNFLMEDVVRQIVGTTASIDGGKTFSEIDINLAGPRKCMERRFPIFLGSSSGVTTINALSSDSLGNIACGGISTDSATLVSSSGNLFVGLLESSGYNFTWVTEIGGFTSGQSVSQLIFSPDDTQILALLSPYPISLLVFNATIGTLKVKVKDTGVLSQASLALDPLTKWVYLAGTTTANELMLAGVDLFINQNALDFIALKVTSSLMAAGEAVFMDLRKRVFIAAQSLSGPASALVEVQISFAGGLFSPSLSNLAILPSPLSDYKNHKLSGWSDVSGAEVLLMTSEPSGLAAKGLLIHLRQLSPATFDQGFIYQENDADTLSVVEVELVSSTLGYLLYKNLLRGKSTLMTLTYAGSGSVKLTHKMLQKPLMTLSNLQAALIKSNGEFYFAGNLQKLSSNTPAVSCMDVTPGSSGFISVTDNVQACQPSSFSISTISTLPLDPSLIFSTVSGVITAMTTLSLSVSTLTNSIIPQENLYLTRNTCCDVPITTGGGIGYTKYVIDYPEETYIFPTFSQSTCLDTFQFWYKREYTIQPALTPATVPYIFFDDYNQLLKFSVSTSDSTTAGSYHIKVTGTLPSHQTSTDMFDYIELWNIPLTEYIVPQGISDQTYIGTDKPLLIQVDHFIPSNLFHTYYIIYYLELWDAVKGLWTRDYDPSIFTFAQQGGRNPNITVYTADNSRKGVYQMRVMGRFSPNTVFEAVSKFMVTILDQCYLNKISVARDLPNEVIFAMLDPRASPIILAFSSWTLSMPQCGPIEYKATLDSGLPLPRFISFSQYTRQFVVTQNQYMRPGTYIIRLQGKLRDFYLMEVMLYNLTVTCKVKNLKAQGGDIQSFRAQPGAPSINFNLQDFVQTPNCGSDIRYELVDANESPVDRAYGRYEESINTLLGTKTRRIFMQAPFDSSSKEVQMKLLAYADGQDVPQGHQRINLQIEESSSSKTRSENKYPPIFQTLQAGSSWEVPFVVSSTNPGGRILSSSGLSVKVTKKEIKYLSGEISANSITLVDTSEPHSYFDDALGKLVLTPADSTEQGTRYAIIAEVEDTVKQSFKITQDLYMIVYRGTNSINMDEEKFLIQGLLDRTKQEFGGKYVSQALNQKLSPWAGKNIKISGPDSTFTAKIHKIDELGQVVIRFSKLALKVENLTQFDDTVLEVKARPGTLNEEDLRDLEVTSWNITYFQGKEMRMRLRFTRPLDISIYEVNDILSIKVLDNLYFLTQNKDLSYSPIQINYKLSKFLPQQIAYGDASLVGGSRSISKGIMAGIGATALMTFLFASNFISLWGTVNVAQMLMIIPLMNVRVPANSQAVFGVLQQLVSFDFFETSQVPLYEDVFTFSEEGSDSSEDGLTPVAQLYGSRFETFGYEYPNMIQNMGTAFVWIVLTLAYQIVILVVSRGLQILDIKIEKVKKLEKDAFFNMNLRLIQEGCFEFLISGIINLQFHDFTTSGTASFSTIFSICIIASIAGLIALSIYVNLKIVKDQSFIDKTERISVIYDGCRTNHFQRINFNLYGVLRRVLLVATLVLLGQYPIAQIFVYMSQALAFSAYLIYYRPLEDPKQMKIEIFNECMVVLASQTLFAFTDFQSAGFDPYGKYLFGWYLTGIILITVLVNTLISLWASMVDAFTYIRDKMRSLREKCLRRGAQLPESQTVSIKPLTSLLDEEFGTPEKNQGLQENLDSQKADAHRSRLLLANKGFNELFEIHGQDDHQSSINNNRQIKEDVVNQRRALLGLPPLQPSDGMSNKAFQSDQQVPSDTLAALAHQKSPDTPPLMISSTFTGAPSPLLGQHKNLLLSSHAGISHSLSFASSIKNQEEDSSAFFGRHQHSNLLSQQQKGKNWKASIIDKTPEAYSL